ncbi:hypothetical protein HQN89_32805 [Paenibacillus frigoriresistens]|nr:hypothetical protein [Paenibacillus frigoriresistens]
MLLVHRHVVEQELALILLHGKSERTDRQFYRVVVDVKPEFGILLFVVTFIQ